MRRLEFGLQRAEGRKYRSRVICCQQDTCCVYARKERDLYREGFDPASPLEAAAAPEGMLGASAVGVLGSSQTLPGFGPVPGCDLTSSLGSGVLFSPVLSWWFWVPRNRFHGLMASFSSCSFAFSPTKDSQGGSDDVGAPFSHASGELRFLPKYPAVFPNID